MRTRAFTLVELILVVAIMATLAGTVVVMAEGTQHSVDEGLVKREALAVREAVLRFHADTGWLPGEGPFDLMDAAAGRHALAAVPLTRVHAQGAPAGQEAAWFDSAANLWQLVASPLDSTPALDHPLERWDPDRARGWRGPYLSLNAEGRVRVTFIGARTIPPLADTNLLLALAPGVADPFLTECPTSPLESGYWESLTEQPLSRQGRPYLLFLPRDPSTGLVLRSTSNVADAPRVVSTGSDGVLGTADDVTAYLFQ